MKVFPYDAYDTVIVDEAHQVKSENSQHIGLLKRLRDSELSPTLWPMTGTPIDNSSKCVAGYCSALNVRSFSWDSDPVLKGINGDILLQDGKIFENKTTQFTNDTNGNSSAEDILRDPIIVELIERLQSFCNKAIIARQHTTLWPDEATAKALHILRQSLTDIHPVPCQSIWDKNEQSADCAQAMKRLTKQFNDEVAKYKEQQAKQGKQVTDQSAITYVVNKTDVGLTGQVATTFPFILLYDKQLALTQDEIKEKRAGRREDLREISDVLWSHEDECWKLRWLRKYIEKNDEPSGFHRGPIKFLFITERVATASTIFKWLERHYPKKKPMYIDGTVPPKHRPAIVRDFQNDEYSDKGVYLSPSILVATRGTMSEGFNITRASRTIIVEALRSSTMIKQAVARTNRLGQIDPDIEARLLRTSDNVFEIRLDRRSGLRDNMRNIATKANEGG